MSRERYRYYTRSWSADYQPYSGGFTTETMVAARAMVMKRGLATYNGLPCAFHTIACDGATVEVWHQYAPEAG